MAPGVCERAVLQLVGPGSKQCRARAQGSAQPSGAPNDVDREFILSYTIEDEVKSFYFDQNLKQLGGSLTNDQQTTLSADHDGAANEHFHAINGAAPTGSLVGSHGSLYSMLFSVRLHKGLYTCKACSLQVCSRTCAPRMNYLVAACHAGQHALVHHVC